MGTNSSLSSWWQAFLPCFFRYFPPLPFHVSNRFSSATCQKCLACRLGVVTGLGQQVSIHMIFYPRALTLVNLDLASHCRLLFHNRAKHTTFWRWFILYPLYVCSEIGIISTDLAELIGSAIALNLLSEAPSLGRSPSHILRCPLDSRLCRPTPQPARAIFRIYDRNLGAYSPTHATIRISLEAGAGRVDMLVYPCF